LPAILRLVAGCGKRALFVKEPTYFVTHFHVRTSANSVAGKPVRENHIGRPTVAVRRWRQEVQVDVTRAILMALADAHPRSLPVDDLAAKVSCEPAALQGQLRLLSQTGAIHAAEEVSITEPAIEMLRHQDSPWRASRH
jgi:hypothetical protein